MSYWEQATTVMDRLSESTRRIFQHKDWCGFKLVIGLAGGERNNEFWSLCYVYICIFLV